MPLNQEDQQKYKALYLQTARQITTEITEGLAKLGSGNETGEVQEALHRDFHSLKGQSEMMEYHGLGRLSRLLEFTFASVRENKLTLSDEMIQKIHEAVGEINNCFDEIEKNDKESDLSEITTNLQSLTKIQL